LLQAANYSRGPFTQEKVEEGNRFIGILSPPASSGPRWSEDAEIARGPRGNVEYDIISKKRASLEMYFMLGHRKNKLAVNASLRSIRARIKAHT